MMNNLLIWFIAPLCVPHNSSMGTTRRFKNLTRKNKFRSHQTLRLDITFGQQPGNNDHVIAYPLRLQDVKYPQCIPLTSESDVSSLVLLYNTGTVDQQQENLAALQTLKFAPFYAFKFITRSGITICSCLLNISSGIVSMSVYQHRDSYSTQYNNHIYKGDRWLYNSRSVSP